MSRFRHLVCVVLFSLFFIAPVFGQTTAPRVELSGGIGISFARPVIEICCALRTPPFFQQLDNQEPVLLFGTGVRVYETKILSTAVRFNWGRMGEVSPTYPSSFASSPFNKAEHVVRPHTFTISILESFDFLTTPRMRPYMSGGVVFSRMSWEQDNISVGLANPTLRQLETDSWSFTRLGFTFDAGVRFYPHKGFLIDTQGGILLLGEKKDRTTGDNWLVKGESQVFLSMQVGVAF